MLLLQKHNATNNYESGHSKERYMHLLGENLRPTNNILQDPRLRQLRAMWKILG